MGEAGAEGVVEVALVTDEGGIEGDVEGAVDAPEDVTDSLPSVPKMSCARSGP